MDRRAALSATVPLRNSMPVPGSRWGNPAFLPWSAWTGSMWMTLSLIHILERAMELHDKLYNLRKKNGYTQSELAEILDVSRQSISTWELGTIKPSTSRLKKLSELYSVPLETLLDDGIEIPLHLEPVYVDAQNEPQEMEKGSSVQDSGKPRWNKKTILITILGAILVLLIGTSLYFVVANNLEIDTPMLEQLGNEEVTIPSGNGFDLQ